MLEIPHVLRGLVQHERRLLVLPAPSARDALVPSPCTILDRRDVTPGLVVSIETFGSYAANLHADVHALATNGAWTAEELQCSVLGWGHSSFSVESEPPVSTE